MARKHHFLIKLIYILLLFCISNVYAVDTPFSIDLGADGHDLEFDSSRNVIYASVPSLNQVVVIDVSTLQLHKTITLNAQPRGLDLSLDATKLYIALNGTGSVGILDLATDVVTEVVVNQLNDLRTWDVEETEENRIFVSANPGSFGLSYIVEILVDSSGNLVSEQRVANGNVIRSGPVFGVSPDSNFLYIGDSGNSLFKLDLNQASSPIVLEDSFTLTGVDKIDLSPDGSRLHTTRGETLRTDLFVHASRNPERGLVAYGQSPDQYFLAERSSFGFNGMTNINYYDSQKSNKLGSFTIPCLADGNSFVDFLILSNDSVFLTLNDNLICGVTTDTVTKDSDSDTVRDFVDNCENIVNSDQSNIDGDEFGDACDSFPNDASNGAINDPDSNQLMFSEAVQDIIYDSARNVFYASIPLLNEIVVVNANTFQIQKRIVVGSSPRGLNLSIDNSKLLVALYGATGFAIVDLLANTVSEIVAEQLGDSRTWDVIETDTNRIFVSASPGSNGFSYIVEVKLDGSGNVISQQRVADGRIIRSGPTFALSPDGDFLYIGDGDGSLLKLDLNQANVPIVLENPNIIGNNIDEANDFVLSPDGVRIHTPRGQVINTDTFLIESQLPVGPVTYSLSGEYLLVAELSTFSNESTQVNVYNSGASQLVGTFMFTCTGDSNSFSSNNILSITADDTFVILSNAPVSNGVICRTTNNIFADSDNDSIFDISDNCPNIANTNQSNIDGDMFGDICDPYPNDANNVPTALELFPLVPGTTFNYLVNSSVQETETILPQSLFNGVQTFGVQDNEGDIEYYTNDVNGLLDYGSLDTVDGFTIISSPPLKFLNAQPILGQQINQSGTLITNDPVIGSLSYTYSSTVIGLETITVPLGTFEALRVDFTLTASGIVFLTQTSSHWYAKDIGLIRDETTTDGLLEVRELVSIQSPPQIVTPAEGSTLPGSSVTITWNANGVTPQFWAVNAGSSPGASNLAASGALAGNVTQTTLTNLPTDGQPIYIRLYTGNNGIFNVVDENQYTAFTPAPTPQIVSPANGSTLSGDSVTITWNANGVTPQNWVVNAGNSSGVSDLATSGMLAGNATQVTLTNLPTNGQTIFVSLNTVDNGISTLVDENQYVAFNPSPGVPQIVTPAEGSTLPGSSVTITWNANGVTPQFWAVNAGSSPGASNLAASGALAGNVTQTTLTNLPTDGQPIYIRLYTGNNGIFNVVDENQYTAFTPAPTPQIVSPANGSTLSGDSVTITWNANGVTPQNWVVNAGNSSGVSDLATSGMLAGNATQVTLTNLPTNGQTIFVSLNTVDNGISTLVDENQYVAFNPSPGVPQIVTPAEGSTLPGSSVTITWNANGVTPQFWAVNAGSSPGASNLAASGALAGNVTQTTLTNLPTDGQPIYIRLYTGNNGIFNVVDENQYTAFTPAPTPQIVSPANGSTLSGDSVTITWNANGVTPQNWVVNAGNSSGVSDLATSGMLAGNATQVTLTNLPTNGQTIFVSLNTVDNGISTLVDENQYVAFNPSPGVPQIVTPAEGSTLPGSSVTITWNANGVTPQFWAVNAGSSPGASNLAASGALAGNVTQTTLTNLPTDGQPIYIRLYTGNNGIFNVVDENQYTAFTPAPTPQIVSPANGSTLSGDSVTITWNANGVTPQNWVVNAGNSSGVSDLATSGMLAGNATQVTLTNLPTNGQTIFVSLNTVDNGISTLVDENQYVAFNPSPGVPQIVTPAEGSTLPGSSVTITWNANGVTPQFWAVNAGSSPGASNLAASGALAGNVTQTTLTNLPTDGQPIYIRLYTGNNGIFNVVDENQYTASQ